MSDLNDERFFHDLTGEDVLFDQWYVKIKHAVEKMLCKPSWCPVYDN